MMPSSKMAPLGNPLPRLRLRAIRLIVRRSFKTLDALTFRDYGLLGQAKRFPDSLRCATGIKDHYGRRLDAIGSKLIGIRPNHNLSGIRQQMPDEECYAPEGFLENYARPVEAWD